MSRYAKLLMRVLDQASEHSIRFENLCGLLVRLGFRERHGAGSHRIFYRQGIAEILNLQPRPDGTCKPYQILQVRQTILRYHLAETTNPESTDEP